MAATNSARRRRRRRRRRRPQFQGMRGSGRDGGDRAGPAELGTGERWGWGRKG